MKAISDEIESWETYPFSKPRGLLTIDAGAQRWMDRLLMRPVEFTLRGSVQVLHRVWCP